MNTKDLLYYNGFGGFSKDGKEYIICTSEDFTPLPWSHIMANERFGCLVTANGGGYVWSGNSRENKITTWCNDMVEDKPSEMLWVEQLNDDNQNEQSKSFLLPYNSLKNFTVTFGFGYAKYEREDETINKNTIIFVPRHDKKKIYIIKLKNNLNETQNLTLHYEVSPVLGVSREYTKKHLIIKQVGDKVTIQNAFREEYEEEIVYIKASEKIHRMFSKDKHVEMSFLVSLSPNEEKEIFIELGILENEEIVLDACQDKLNEIKNYWEEVTSKVKIKTPVESMNILMNGWLIYQTIVSRLWGRTSFYQAGGAFGFRDQLQDSLIMLYYDPVFTRNQIIYHAKHQFPKGDVLHWWHPEKNNGIRTRYSDDLLWLPFVLCEYIQKENDVSILEEQVPYVVMEELKNDENERYENTSTTDYTDSLYIHAKKAIEKSLNFGEHNLPKMGSGDWNDGMNKICGESVWLRVFSI